MFALILVILVPAFAVALILLMRTNDAQDQVVRALTNATVQAMGHSVDREIAGMGTTLRVLSSDSALYEGDLAQFHDRGVEALAGTGTYLLAVDADMNQLLNTRVSYGEPLGKTSDDETAILARERGVATVSSLFFGQTAQSYVFNVWLPVSNAGSTVLLALTQNAANLVPALQSRQMPAGWHAALVDRGNTIIAATSEAGLRIGDILPLRRETTTNASDWTEEVVNDQRVVTAEWRSGLSGWRIVAWASAAQVSRPLGESVLQLTAWGVAIALVASLIAFLLAQRIRRSVQGLQREARRLGRGEIVTAGQYPVAEITEISTTLAESSAQLQAAERDVRFLMRELAHRSKNQMAVIAAMAKQTARGTTDVPTYVQALERRIMGLARSTDLLLAHGRAGVGLSDLVDQQLAPFRPADGRILVSGPTIRINPQGAQILGMALHELATNATRYGAIADPGGQIRLDWRIADERLVLDWRETLSQPLPPPGRAGFGTTVLLSMVGGALGATVIHHDHADGVEWTLSIPLSALDPGFAAVRPDEDMDQ
ncbi:MAG: hypothetical protein BGO80_10565 [Devosia sp. 63-57]|nr:MAG: hypothetical protein ABS74_11155 [Pelagibacterium sp. SCN 63-126]ODU85847.1 MAG: hypothetical protein ABT14_11200 [Pelagibacterium sp. SCN 63-17]OJX43554.1 MAG: hypothetical protein BGO80_10565 [Devosia sp. 63-57]